MQKFSSWPYFTDEEAEAVRQVLLSNKVNYWTGCECREFEREYATYLGVKHAIAVANGTLALEVALRALEIGQGDEVIVTSRTFLASVSCIVTVGAKPVFADIDLDTQNITPLSIRKVLTSNTKAIIAVHLAGWPCDMDSMMELAKELNLKVIEDCAQAHGAKYKGRSVGSIGHIGAWSFCQDKIMTTGGEGGMVTTNDKKLWEKMWSYKDHGKSWKAVYETKHPPGFRWLHESFGSNYRMTEMQAAIGRIQIKRMSEWHEARKQNAEAILTVSEEYPKVFRVPSPPEHVEHAWYKCYVFVKVEGLRLGWNRDKIIAEINSLGVPCYSGSFSEVYLEKAFEGTNFRPKDRLPVAKELGETSLMFLVHPTLGDAEMDLTKSAIRIVMNQAML